MARLFVSFLGLCAVVLALLCAMSMMFPATSSPATAQVVRINQLDQAQYSSLSEYKTWAPSTCSATVMAEAMNSYGHSYHVTDVLKVEAAFTHPQVISPSEGLLYPGGFDRTLHAFGFGVHWLQNPTIAQVVAAAPVIVNFPPSRWPGGHFLIVAGGDDEHVRLVDSSSLNMQSMDLATFRKYWAGFAFQVIPQQGGQQ